MANLFYQMYSAVEDGFGDDGGVKKRAIQGDDSQSTKDFVFSRSEWDRLKDAASDFSDWAKVEHPDIKKVCDIDSSVVKEFLLSKHRENGGTCNSNTVNTMASSLDKMSHLIDKKFGIDTDWTVKRSELPQDTEKLRTLVMTRDILGDAMDSMKDWSQGKFATTIMADTAMRVSEPCKLQVRDFNFDDLKVHIHESKGGKSRDIDISSATAETVKEWIEEKGLKDKDKLITIRPDSINNLICESTKRTGHSEFAEHKTSGHAIRKMVAQEKYEAGIRSYLDKGESWEKAEKHALADTSVFLGHGDQRTIEEYINRSK